MSVHAGPMLRLRWHTECVSGHVLASSSPWTSEPPLSHGTTSRGVCRGCVGVGVMRYAYRMAADPEGGGTSHQGGALCFGT